MYKIYTDGSYSQCTNEGGWGVVVTENNKKIETLRGYQKRTTVNKLELSAAIEALKYDFPVKIYTDCKYVSDGYNIWAQQWKENNWKKSNKKDIKHKELWKIVLSLKHPLKEIIWIKGHNGNKFNEQADKIAKSWKI